MFKHNMFEIKKFQAETQMVVIKGHSLNVNLKIGVLLPPVIVWLCIEISTCMIKYGEKQTLEQMDLGKWHY